MLCDALAATPSACLIELAAAVTDLQTEFMVTGTDCSLARPRLAKCPRHP